MQGEKKLMFQQIQQIVDRQSGKVEREWMEWLILAQLMHGVIAKAQILMRTIKLRDGGGTMCAKCDKTIHQRTCAMAWPCCDFDEYHQDCIKFWWDGEKACPYCQNPIVQRSVALEIIGRILVKL